LGLITKKIWRAYFHLPGPQHLMCPGTIFLLYPLLQALIVRKQAFTTFSVEKDLCCVSRVS